MRRVPPWTIVGGRSLGGGRELAADTAESAGTPGAEEKVPPKTDSWGTPLTYTLAAELSGAEVCRERRGGKREGVVRRTAERRRYRCRLPTWYEENGGKEGSKWRVRRKGEARGG